MSDRHEDNEMQRMSELEQRLVRAERAMIENRQLVDDLYELVASIRPLVEDLKAAAT